MILNRVLKGSVVLLNQSLLNGKNHNSSSIGIEYRKLRWPIQLRSFSAESGPDCKYDKVEVLIKFQKFKFSGGKLFRSSQKYFKKM